MTDEAIAALAPRIGTRAACAASGVPQATWYRRHRISTPAPKPATVPHAGRVQPRALAPAERQAILDALHSDRFADTALAEVWAILRGLSLALPLAAAHPGPRAHGGTSGLTAACTDHPTKST